jgi:hypothetical protein
MPVIFTEAMPHSLRGKLVIHEWSLLQPWI